MARDQDLVAYGRIVARAWADDGFKAGFLADPIPVLKAEGFAIPPGAAVTVLENTSTRRIFVLPLKPTDLSDEELDGIGGGFGWCFTL